MSSCNKSVYAFVPSQQCWSLSAYIAPQYDFKLNVNAFSQINACYADIPICFSSPVYYLPSQANLLVEDLNNSNFNAVLSGNLIIIDNSPFNFSNSLYSQYFSAFSTTPSAYQVQYIQKYISPLGETVYVNKTTNEQYLNIQSNWVSSNCMYQDGSYTTLFSYISSVSALAKQNQTDIFNTTIILAQVYESLSACCDAHTSQIQSLSNNLDPNFLTLAGPVDVNWNLNNYSISNVATLTLTGNKILNIKNLVPGSQGTLILNQDVSGNRTLVFPITSKFINGGPYTFSPQPSATDIYNFTFDGSNLLWTRPTHNPISKFTPTDIEGVVAWYSPETIPNTSNVGTTVSVWDDKSGYANHLYAQAGGGGNHTGALLTNNLNGYNVVRFNGASYPNGTYLQTRNQFPLSAFTVFGISRRNDATNLGRVWSHWNTDNTTLQLLSFYEYGSSYVYRGGTSNLQDVKGYRSYWPNGTNWTSWSQGWSGSYMFHDLYVNGKFEYYGRASTGYTPGVSAVSAKLGLGDVPSYGSQVAMDMAEFIVYNRYLTDAERSKVSWYLTEKFNLPVKDYLRNSIFVLCDGNSMTEGQGIYEYDGTPPAGRRFWELAFPALSSRNYSLWSVAIGGQTTTNMASDFLTHSRQYYNPYRKGNIVFAWEVTNEISTGSTDTVAYANYVNYCNLCRNAGWKVIAATVIPRSSFSGTQETYRQNVNTLIRNNYTTFADGLADFAAHPHFDNSADANGPWPNASNYYDGTHLINYSAIAQVASAAILSVQF